MWKYLSLALALVLLLSGCVPATLSPTPEGTEATVAPAGSGDEGGSGAVVTVMTHDSFSVSEEVVAAFQEQCNCTVSFLRSGDAGLALNQAILSKDNPLADVFFGVDNTFLSRALEADIFEPYDSPELASIPDDLKLDPSNRLLPVDFGYVALNYDRAYFATNDVPLPETLRDLTDPAYEGLLVVENPATSSPGLAFLASTVAAFGEEGDYTYLDFWADLRANDVLVTQGWEDAYYGQFSGSAGSEGDRPLVVSYATSPAAEVFFADPQPEEAPTGNALLGESFRQVEFAGVLANAANPELAREWLDFMLGETFQADIPLQMFVYPARTGTPLPDVFVEFAEVPETPITLDPAQLDAGREQWLQEWTDTVLR